MIDGQCTTKLAESKSSYVRRIAYFSEVNCFTGKTYLKKELELHDNSQTMLAEETIGPQGRRRI